MKNKVLLFVVLLQFFPVPTHAIGNENFEFWPAQKTYSFDHTGAYNPGGAAYRTGLAVCGVGAGLIIVGALVADHADGFNSIGGVFIGGAGAIVFIVGGGITIGGILHDNHHRHRSFGLVAPKPKQVGLVYNF